MNQAFLTHSLCRRNECLSPRLCGGAQCSKWAPDGHSQVTCINRWRRADRPANPCCRLSLWVCSGLLQLGVSNPGLLERDLILHSGKTSEQVLHKISLWLIIGFMVVFSVFLCCCWGFFHLFGVGFFFVCIVLFVCFVLFVWGFFVCQNECHRGSGAFNSWKQWATTQFIQGLAPGVWCTSQRTSLLTQQTQHWVPISPPLHTRRV